LHHNYSSGRNENSALSSFKDLEDFFHRILQINQHTPNDDFYEIIRLLKQNHLGDLFDHQLPPKDPSFSRINRLTSRPLLAFFMDYSKSHLANWSIENLENTSVVSNEFLSELLVFLEKANFTHSSAAVRKTGEILTDPNRPAHLKMLILNKLDTQFFQQLKLDQGQSILHKAGTFGAEQQVLNTILGLVSPNVFLMQDDNQFTPLDYIRMNRYPTPLAMALLASTPLAAFTLLDRHGKNIFHRLFSRNIPEVVLERLFSKAPIEAFYQKTTHGFMPGHFPNGSLTFFNKLLNVYPREYFSHAKFVQTYYRFAIQKPSTLEHLHLALRLAPLSSLFINPINPHDEKIPSLKFMLEGHIADRPVPDSWDVFLTRLKNTPSHEFLEETPQRETFISLLIEDKPLLTLLKQYPTEAEKLFATVFNKIDTPLLSPIQE
jgi:hypothetical protein